jgi:hypothetical protein
MKEDKKTNSVSLVDASSWAPQLKREFACSHKIGIQYRPIKKRGAISLSASRGDRFSFFFASGAASGDGEKGQNQSKV